MQNNNKKADKNIDADSSEGEDIVASADEVTSEDEEIVKSRPEDDQPLAESEPTDVIASEAKQSSEELDSTKIATSPAAPRNDEDEAQDSTDDSETSKPSGASVADEPSQNNAEGQTDEPSKETIDEQPAPKPASNDDPNAKWYVVHTYSGHENKVAATLRQRIESEHLQAKIFDILVPVQDKIEIKGGKKHEIKEKIFPGYILVKMVLEDNTWIAVRTTQGVTSFVGMGNKPTPISESEVQTIVRFSQIQQPTFKQIFMADDTVKIVDGPFAEFIGKVDSVDEEKGKVRVLVSIFGRETPVELDFLQVQKI